MANYRSFLPCRDSRNFIEAIATMPDFIKLLIPLQALMYATVEAGCANSPC
jgi:hypothetical protein